MILLCAFQSAALCAPATLTKDAWLKVYGSDTYLGRQIFPAGTRVDASTGADGKVSVTTEYGATAYLPADGVRFDPVRRAEPTITPAIVPPPAVPREEPTAASVDITTLSGRVYRDAKASRVEPDGVTIQFDGGTVKIPFEEMPEKYRLAYHYDPEAAAAYRQAVQAALKRQTQEKETIEAERNADPDSPLTPDEINLARSVPPMDAQVLINAYERNEISADRDAKGMVFRFRGAITDISRDFLGVPYVMLEHGVRCAFPKGNEDQLTTLVKGQTVVITGRIHGATLGGVSVDRCGFYR